MTEKELRQQVVDKFKEYIDNAIKKELDKK